MSRTSRILHSIVPMYFCPPKPGLTVMTRTMSMRSRTFSTADAGVAGLRATAAVAPSERMLSRVRCRWVHASACTMRREQPAFTYSAAMTSGVSTIRCASKGRSQWRRAAAITSGPKVRFGTNWPSITSHWIRSTPAASRSRTALPSSAKSAGRTDGAI